MIVFFRVLAFVYGLVYVSRFVLVQVAVYVYAHVIVYVFVFGVD